MWRVGLWGEVWEGRGRMLQRMMGRKLIHSRTTTREHFFYGNPKLENEREGGCYCFCCEVKGHYDIQALSHTDISDEAADGHAL